MLQSKPRNVSRHFSVQIAMFVACFQVASVRSGYLGKPYLGMVFLFPVVPYEPYKVLYILLGIEYSLSLLNLIEVWFSGLACRYTHLAIPN